MTDKAEKNAKNERNDADWVKESVVRQARETGTTCKSGAWLASPVEGKDRIDVYRYAESTEDA